MHKLKIINKSPERLMLVCVPGGPGLGPKSFERLAEYANCNIAFYDPTGIPVIDGKNPCYKDHYDDLVSALAPLNNFVLCGHSFGGILATEVALAIRERVKGLICLSTPYSANAFDAIIKSFTKHMTPELEQAEEDFQKNPTNGNYLKSLLAYREIFFFKNEVDAGNSMLHQDSISAVNFLGTRAEANNKGHLLGELKKSALKAIFLNGKNDKLFPLNAAKDEAANGGFSFYEISNAGHFVHFDNAKDTAQIINSFITHLEVSV